VDGEFFNNPMSFNADKTWLAVDKIAELASERKFIVHDPVNMNEDWKGLTFSNKKALSKALEERHVIHFVRMKIKKSDTNHYTCVCVESNCR
jgi:hypothetical protein